MCTPSTPPLLFTAHSATIWAATVNSLSGYMVTVTMLDGSTRDGELLGDGETGRYLRLSVGGREETLFARSVASVTIL